MTNDQIRAQLSSLAFLGELKDKMDQQDKARDVMEQRMRRGGFISSKLKHKMRDKAGLSTIKATRLKSTHLGRNDPCPCGSGKKYKHCCL